MAAVKRIGAVSPATLPMFRMMPVRMPGRAVGRTTFFMVCQCVAPRAREASLKDWGTARMASCEAEMIPGRAMMPSVRLPERMETPKPNALTKTAKPKRPNTTDGTPAKLLMLRRMMFTA